MERQDVYVAQRFEVVFSRYKVSIIFEISTLNSKKVVGGFCSVNKCLKKGMAVSYSNEYIVMHMLEPASIVNMCSFSTYSCFAPAQRAA